MPKRLSPTTYIDGVLKGNRVLLSQAITLIESNLDSDFELAQNVLNACIPFSGKSIRIGITGSPGVGKSTFIESFGLLLCQKGLKVAVLAVDPSSQISHGSILGDKTRMENLSVHPNAYIRPSASSGSLGGVNRKTRESLILCESAGFDIILVETVGVGQSETIVREMVDFFLLLIQSNSGDELQGIKKGIVEMADCLVITKADGNNKIYADISRKEYQKALHYFHHSLKSWITPVLTVSSIENEGLNSIFEAIQNFKILAEKEGFWNQNRENQLSNWFKTSIFYKIFDELEKNKTVQMKWKELEIQIKNKEINVSTAVELFTKKFLNIK